MWIILRHTVPRNIFLKWPCHPGFPKTAGPPAVPVIAVVLNRSCPNCISCHVLTSLLLPTLHLFLHVYTDAIRNIWLNSVVIHCSIVNEKCYMVCNLIRSVVMFNKSGAVQTHGLLGHVQSDTKKNGNFWKTQQKLKKSKKKNLLTEIEPLKLAF